MTGADPVLDVCDACESGVIYRAHHPNDPDWSNKDPCGHCDGTGFILIDADAIEMEDLADVAR